MNSQETCLALHGFFDIEERSCITVHRLVKVCLKVKLDEQTGQWSIDETKPDP